MSIAKKLSNLDTGAFIEGRKNYKNPVPEVERLSEERVLTCTGCNYFEDESISFMRVADERIPEASGKMCGDCGCILPYKLRQSKEVCRFWDK